MSVFSKNKKIANMAVRKINREQKMYVTRKKLTAEQKQQVKKMIVKDQELKYYGYTYSGVSITSTGSLSGLPFDIPQQTTSGSDTVRVGDQITLCGSVQMIMQLNVADVHNVVRLVILQWKSLSTATPTPVIGDIFLPGPSLAIDVHSIYNHDTRSSFNILFDRTFTLIGNGTTGYPYTTSSIINRSYNISLKRANKKVDYVGGGGQGKNRLFFYYISDSGISTHPTMTLSFKTVFRDA